MSAPDIHGHFGPCAPVPEDVAARAADLVRGWCERNGPAWSRSGDGYFDYADAHNAAVTSDAGDDRPIVEFIVEVRGNLHTVALVQAFQAAEAAALQGRQT